MESLLLQINNDLSKMLIEYNDRDPKILKEFFDGLEDKEKADIEMSKMVKEPVDKRIVNIACQNDLTYTLECIKKTGYELTEKQKKYLEKK